MESYKIIWNNKEVGLLINPRPDMWYLEGHWEPNDTSDCQYFKSLITPLNTKEVFNDLTKGISIYLRNIETGSEIHAVVISLLENGILFIRTMSAH